MLEFELGNLDECFIPEEEFHRIAENPQWQPLLTPLDIPDIAYLGFNLTKSPMSDSKFREAFRYAIDRKGILEIVLNNHGSLTSTSIPFPETEVSEYSISSAHLLFSTYPKKMVTMVVNKNEREAHLIAQRIQANLLEAGYPIKIAELPSGEFNQRVREGNFDLFFAQYYADIPDPELILRSLFLEKNFGSEGNQTFYYHPQLESILDIAKTSSDGAERNNNFLRATQLIQKDIPMIFLFQATPYLIKQPRVVNVDRLAYQYRILKNVWLNKLLERPVIIPPSSEQKGQNQ